MYNVKKTSYTFEKKVYILFNKKEKRPSVSATGQYMVTTHKIPCELNEGYVSKEVKITIL